MSIIGLIAWLCILGGIAWAVNAKAPIGPTFKLIINIVLIVIATIIVLSAFGLWDEISHKTVPRL